MRMLTNNAKWHKLISQSSPCLGLTKKGLDYVLHVVSNPPDRNPSNATGANLIVDMASRKMERTMPVESLTVEAAYAQMLEIPIPCTGYWVQPLKLPILCTGRDGIKRTVWLTFDFLVVYPDRVELVECKTEAEALSLSLELPGRYSRNDKGQWIAPEVEAALADYGIKFRIVTTADLNPKLLRNYALLDEARQDTYSAPTALERILDCFAKNNQGIALADLLKKAGSEFTKNDIYFGILRNDLHVLLDECLLVDDQTTLVLSNERAAEIHRLLNIQTKSRATNTILLRAGSRLKWNGAEYTVCNASSEKIYLRSKNDEPTAFSKRLLCSLLQSGEIEALDEIAVSIEAQQEALKKYQKVLTRENQALANRRLRFLHFRKANPEARPECFDLEIVTDRTIQRWANAARESTLRYGTAFWGLLDQPRDGRPRDDLPSVLREEMTRLANELYFTKESRSLCYVWRALRKSCLARGLHVPSKGALRRHVAQLKNLRETTESREGKKAAYKYGNSDLGAPNWITPSDFPFKVGQMDGKTLDIEVVDNETGEPLGKPTLTLITLPHYGSAPIGWALLLEPESYRSATMATRDVMERFGEFPKFLIKDNGKAFNNTTFDTLLGTLSSHGVNRRPHDPRFSSEIESLFRTLDREIIHSLAGNTKPTQNVREMSGEMDPKKSAVWTFQALHERLEHYLFTMLWDAHSASLGTKPRLAFERDMKKAPDREGLFVIPSDQAKIAYFPEVDGHTRVVQPGRGVFVEGYYYWCPSMADARVEKTAVAVRYDPFDLYVVFAAIGGLWVECTARHAPELRNVTERTRRMQVVIRRRLKNDQAKQRENHHGRSLADFGEENRRDEKIMRQERRARAQQHSVDKNQRKSPEKPSDSPSNRKIALPQVDFSYLAKTA